MAGGVGFSPLSWLQNLVAQGSQGASPPPPAPAAPPAAPPLPTAATPGATEVGGGGAGGQGVMQGIGGALNRAMSGEGVFGSPLEGAADPMTGMTPEMSRRMNGQSIMKMGMLLMAAGARQGDDSRARLLSQLPNAIDNSDQINSFARNRLEMAKVKLMEAEAARTAAADARFDSLVSGLTGSGAGGGSGPSPAGVPPTAPAPSATPTGVGAVGPVPSAPVPPVTTPALTGTTTKAPVNSAATPDQMPVGEPQQPPPPGLSLSPEEIRMWPAMGRDTVKQLLKERMGNAAQTEYFGPQYFNPQTGNIERVKYKGMNRIGAERVDDAPTTVRDSTPDENGMITRETILPNGQVVKRDTVNVQVLQQQKTDDQRHVRTRSEAFEKMHADEVKPAIKTYERAIKLAGEVDNGQGNFGTLADARRALLTAAATTGIIKEEGVKDLLTNLGVAQVTGEAAGQLLSKYYKPASNIDVETVNRLTGALNSTDRKTVAEALRQIARSQRSTIENYNSQAQRHNERAGIFKMDQYKAPVVEYNFDAPPAATPEAPKRQVWRKNPQTGLPERVSE